jgi:hypothetical protein
MLKKKLEVFKMFLIAWYYLGPNDAGLLEAYCDILFSAQYA